MKHKSSKVRSVALIVTGLMLGALTIAPAFANHTPKHTAKQIKKVKKALNKKIKKLPTTSAVAQSIEAALDERINLFGGSYVKATATAGADEATARAAAPKVPLLTVGPFSIYGKCFSYPVDEVTAEVYIETSVNGAIFEGFDDLPGGNTLAEFLNTTTPEVERQVDRRNITAPDAFFDETEFAAMAPGGAAFNGLTGTAVKGGNLTEGNGIYGDGNVCLFSGVATGN